MSFWFKLKLCWDLLSGWPPSKERKALSYTPKEQKDLLKSLMHHPGFQILSAHKERVKASVERTRKFLTPGTQSSELFARDMVKIDEAIFWISWDQAKIKAAGVEIILPPENPEIL